MKVKCIQLLNADGKKIESCNWLKVGRIYHVMAIHLDSNGQRTYSIITQHREGEWPEMANHLEECFEVVSDVIPSNWSQWTSENESGISPTAWQQNNFSDDFYDHDPAVYSVFEKERDIILSEDP